MTKARRQITADSKLVDAVCEVIDARIPRASRNPDVADITLEKPRLIVMSRIDQADPAVTKLWNEHFRLRGEAVIEVDCKTGHGVQGFPSAVRALLRHELERRAEKGQSGRAIRVMVVGVPNVGKSSFINRVARRKAAHSSDKPGVTRGRQWITVDSGLELLDTPGILWPKFDDKIIGENLAFTGAVRDEILDAESLGANLLARLSVAYPKSVTERYGIVLSEDGFAMLTALAKRRGFLLSGGECDLLRAANILLDEFRGGKLGRVSLEKPEAL